MFVLAVCVLLLFGAPGNAQQTTVVQRETFENNDRAWVTGEVGNLQAEVADGVFRLEMTADDGWQYLSHVFPLDNAKNWTLTARLRQVSGAEDNPYGLVYNSVDSDNTYQFMITSEGKARLRRFKEGETQDLLEWTDVEAIKGQDDWNEITIRKVNDAVAFFVNGVYVTGYSASYFLVFGPQAGPYVQWSQTIEVDDILLEEWPMDPVDVVQGADAGATPVNLGAGVNSEADELVDAIAPDGSILMFSRQGDSRNVGSADYRDVWFAERKADGSWAKATNPGTPLNTSTHNFGVAMTQDLNTIFMQGVYYDDGTTSTGGGVSYAHRTRTGWSKPVSMSIDDYYNNSSFLNSHISPDGQVLIMSIWRNDTRGGNDLYVCFRQPNDTWSAPKNIGSTINTQGEESGPFIAADGKTMYFSSNGHRGYEGRDIFVTVRQDESWTNWSAPKNLGKPINTDEHDTFFQVTAKGDSGYYSSTKNSMGQADIFSIALPRSARPEALIMIRGRVLDAETGKPVEATVVYERLPEGTTVGTARSAPSDGQYRVGLVRGVQYGVRAEASGYYPLSETMDARELGEYTEQVRDLLLSPIKKNVAIRLNNVFFDSGKYDLRPESFPELDRLVEFLRKNGSVSIEIGGHTDNIGSDKDNATLSQNRVNSVMAYLVAKSIPAGRVTAKGYGESKPLASNDTEEGRQQNRRVEFTILQQ